TTPASPRKLWLNVNLTLKISLDTTLAAKNSLRKSGNGRKSPAAPSPNSSAALDHQPTGSESTSPWTTTCHGELSKRSFACTSKRLSIGASASSTGSRSLEPQYPISRWSAKKKTDRCGKSATRLPNRFLVSHIWL